MISHCSIDILLIIKEKTHVQILPDDGDQNQEFQVYEQMLHYLVVQMFQDKPPKCVTREKNTANELYTV